MKLSLAATVLAGVFGIAQGAGHGTGDGHDHDDCEVPTVTVEIYADPTKETTIPLGLNPCKGKKPADGGGFDNFPCGNIYEIVEGAVNMKDQPQAGANVTKGYKGFLNSTAPPITDPYYMWGLCPVNVHWHLGAEHLSVGEYDETGSGPTEIHERRRLAGKVRQGFQCTHYDANDEKFTKPYDWKHCTEMEVGQTYEVHWPHSSMGDCGTPYQYQYPFYDGVLCNYPERATPNRTLSQMIGVQGQVFTIVNDEDYYYPNLINGMIMNGDFGKEITAYTGSTTGTSRNNEMCSAYTPITWQVDRKCHLISASSFDQMCADMKAQRDDMSDDLYAHGSRELVNSTYAGNNHADYVAPP